MDSENLYYVWEKMENYINPKDKKQAIEEFLMVCYENDANIYELLETSDESFIHQIKIIIWMMIFQKLLEDLLKKMVLMRKNGNG